MKRKVEWHENARWLYGPLGQLHAQWLEDDGGASVHSEDAGLSGEPQPFNPRTACSACVMMVRSAYQSANNAAKEARDKRPHMSGSLWGEARVVGRTRMERLGSMARYGHVVTPGLVRELWPHLRSDAVHQLLRRACQRGYLARGETMGEYVKPQETQAA